MHDSDEFLEGGEKVIWDNSINPLTAHELHSMVLGSGLGIILGLEGRGDLVIALAIGAYVNPLPRHHSVGLKTVVLEPWYFIGPLVAMYLVGRGISLV